MSKNKPATKAAALIKAAAASKAAAAINTDELWQCSDGRIIRISDMDDRHLLNCMRLMERRVAPLVGPNENPQAAAGRLWGVYRAMSRELARRLESSAKQNPPALPGQTNPATIRAFTFDDEKKQTT
jgi:hypothetical protein